MQQVGWVFVLGSLLTQIATRSLLPACDSFRSELGDASMDEGPQTQLIQVLLHSKGLMATKGNAQQQYLTRCSQAEELLLRAGCCWVQGGSVQGSVVRQFPSSLHLSRGSAQLPSSPSLRLPSACAAQPASSQHQPGRFSWSLWLVAR